MFSVHICPEVSESTNLCFVSSNPNCYIRRRPSESQCLRMPEMTYGAVPRRVVLQALPFLATFVPLTARSQATSSSEITAETTTGAEDSEIAKTRADIDPSTNEPEVTNRAYLDVSIDNKQPHRIEVALYGTIAPKTVANFLKLCENGYANTKVYRIVPGLTIQLGDVLNNNGRSGQAATDSGWLDAETFRIMHSMRGVVSMVTKGGRVDSRFFVTTRRGDSAYLDGKYVAFGRVVEGMDFLDEIERQGEGFVRKPVRIVASGVVQ